MIRKSVKRFSERSCPYKVGHGFNRAMTALTRRTSRNTRHPGAFAHAFYITNQAAVESSFRGTIGAGVLSSARDTQKCRIALISRENVTRA
jgi:hypothetical protein